MSYQKQWRPIWTGKLYGRYQYENWDKVEKEDRDLVRILNQEDGSHAIRTENGQLFDYWFNSADNPKNKSRKPQVTRRVPEGWQPNNQGTQPEKQTSIDEQQPTFEERLDIYKRDLNEALGLLKEIFKSVTGKDWDSQAPAIQRGSGADFKGEDYKVNHGNELTGSAAGTGIDTMNAMVDPYPEITEKSAFDEDQTPERLPREVEETVQLDADVGPEQDQ